MTHAAINEARQGFIAIQSAADSAQYALLRVDGLNRALAELSFIRKRAAELGVLLDPPSPPTGGQEVLPA